MNTRQSSERNISMVMDFYEMTMANGYFKNSDPQTRVAFDVFYRKNPDKAGFSIFAGLQQIVEYIEDLHFTDEDVEYFRSLHLFEEEFLQYLKDFEFHGDIYSFAEGTIMYPGEPIITVVAPVVEAQIVETAILLLFNHESLIATKTQRIVRSAQGRAVSDFGARRAHNVDAAVYGARAAVIGGAVGTATVLAGQYFDIPISGTMAHSWVEYFNDEFTAFKTYAETYPDATVLLVDTYDVLRSGVPNAIRVAKEVLEPAGHRLKGIRLDSGDLAYLSKKARKMLDEAGCNDCIIVASNSLDEYTIESLIDQGAKIDSFGVGERLITSSTNPVFGGVYKLCAVEEDGKFAPRIKVSENVEKITNPGLKKVYRIYNDGMAIADLIALWDEEVPEVLTDYEVVDPMRPWDKVVLKSCTAKPLQELIVKDGKTVGTLDSAKEIAAFVKKQLSTEIWEEEQRFENPHYHYMDFTPAMWKLKQDMLREISSRTNG